MLEQQHPTPLSLTMALPEPVVDRPVGLAPAPGRCEVVLVHQSAVAVWVG